jgi:hypothetical protein
MAYKISILCLSLAHHLFVFSLPRWGCSLNPAVHGLPSLGLRNQENLEKITYYNKQLHDLSRWEVSSLHMKETRKVIECIFETTTRRQKFEDLVLVICNLKLPWRNKLSLCARLLLLCRNYVPSSEVCLLIWRTFAYILLSSQGWEKRGI